MNGVLGRDAILAVEDLKRETVDVPEWGGTVMVRMLTAAERNEYLARSVKTGTSGKMEADPMTEAILVSMTACDSDGRLLFMEKDVPALAAKSAAAVGRVAHKAADLNELFAGARRRAAKNS